jgi:DNA-directed RNA polymerase specialized sigma24 family protein
MDRSLLRAAREGEPRALDAVGRWWYSELRTFFSERFPPNEARELIQEASKDIMAKFATHASDDPDAFRAMVLSFAGMLAHAARGERQRVYARQAKLRDNPPSMNADPSLSRQLDAAQQRQKLIEHARRLRTIYRDALMHALDGGDYRSLAASKGIPEGTASRRLTHAKKLVARSIEGARRTDPAYRSPPNQV